MLSARFAIQLQGELVYNYHYKNRSHTQYMISTWNFTTPSKSSSNLRTEYQNLLYYTCTILYHHYSHVDELTPLGCMTPTPGLAGSICMLVQACTCLCRNFSGYSKNRGQEIKENENQELKHFKNTDSCITNP